ncbi:MAG TPA: alpha-2-macroglobulin family protein, partial [Pedobacter sp.]|nr:alpha-2-macroglobulin family protein [Pedobacter sp.]
MKQGLRSLLILLLAVTAAYGQKRLSTSRTTSTYTYIYKLTDEESFRIASNPRLQIDDSFMHTLVDSFYTDSKRVYAKRLPYGNYLDVKAIKGSLQYRLRTLSNVNLQIVGHEDRFQFAVIDQRGKLIQNGDVTTGQHRNTRFDPRTGLYNAAYNADPRVIAVRHDGITSYFSYSKRGQERKPSFFRRLFQPDANPTPAVRKPRKKVKTYAGQLLFNKPKYRPLDTVKFKAYILTEKGRPISNKILNLVITEDDDVKVKLFDLKPYREGGYEGSFVLSDTMNLILDEDYLLEFRELIKGEWATVTSKSFTYEDYELKSTTFNVRADQDSHAIGHPMTFYMRATDENELPVPDVKVEVVIKAPHADVVYDQEAFIKDTLWSAKVALDPVGETKLTVPDDIFPNAKLYLTAEFTFSNSNNEVRREKIEFSHDLERKYVSTSLQNDSVRFDYLVNGKSTPIKATIYSHYKDFHGLDSIKTTLPYLLKINQHNNNYNTKTEKGTYYASSMYHLRPSPALSLSQTKDSLTVSVGNPHKLHFWYTLYEGKKPVSKGYTDHLDTAMRFSNSKTANLVVNYTWGGDISTLEASSHYKKEILKVALTAPSVVYPGETVNMQIKVTDQEDKPVTETDVTAYAHTSKFAYSDDPVLNTFNRPVAIDNNLEPVEWTPIFTSGNIRLNWTKWGRELGLDTIAYYQFTQTKDLYTTYENLSGDETAVAPFVVSDGNVIPVQIVYIDDVPVYYSHAEQLKRYAFFLTPGKHKIALRTLDRLVEFEAEFSKGKKTIIGVANALSNIKARVSVMPDELTAGELALLGKYMLYVRDNFAGAKATITSASTALLLNNPPRQAERRKTLLIGPIKEDHLIFKSGPIDEHFEKRPENVYTFLPGLTRIKPHNWANGLNSIFNSNTENTDLGQQPLRTGEIDSIWNDYLNMRSRTTRFYPNPEPDKTSTVKLIMEVDTSVTNHAPYLKNIIIYKHDDPSFMTIYPGTEGSFPGLSKGKYKIMYLLKDNSYFLQKEVTLRSGGFNYFRWKPTVIHAADAMSNKLDQQIKSAADRKIESYVFQEDPPTVAPREVIKSNGPVVRVRGRVFDEATLQTLPGVSFYYRKNKNSMPKHVFNANFDGGFDVLLPKKGLLLLASVGFDNVEMPIKENQHLIIKMRERITGLYDVVIRGYMNDGAPGLRGSVNIRGKGLSIMSGGGVAPLVFVDNLPFNGKLEDLDQASIVSMEVLKDHAAIKIYGSAGASGVIMIRTKAGAAPGSEIEAARQQQTMRSNFSDYAIWQPKLSTDLEGRASFKVKFPDDITNWTTRVLAINHHKQTGFYRTNIKAFKTLSANFISPSFAITGDSIRVIGKLMNYGNAEETALRKFSYNGKELLNSKVSFKNSYLDTVGIVALSAEKDSLRFQYTMQQDNGYFDGELRKIPVLPLGTIETKGYFNALLNDTTTTYNFSADLGKVTLRAEASLFPVLLDEIGKLRDYEYLCNEQQASKLKALLLEKKIRGYLKEDFNGDKHIRELIKNLQNNASPRATWGWWQNSSEEFWISLHVVEALLMAEQLGYKATVNRDVLSKYLTDLVGENPSHNMIQAVKLLRLVKPDYSVKDFINGIKAEPQSLNQKLQ